MAPAKREPFNARKGGDIMPRGVFDDGTTYRTGFVPKEVGVPAQFRPQDAGALHTGDFEGNTEYRNQFIDKEVPGAARGGGEGPGAERREERYWKRLNKGQDVSGAAGRGLEGGEEDLENPQTELGRRFPAWPGKGRAERREGRYG